jgi:thymidylate synthase (FAD)
VVSEVKVLDHGYVKLTHKMVDLNDDETCRQTLDEMAVAAARVSYGGDLKGEEKDRKLLHYLLEHEHGSPLESAVFRFEVKCPIFVMRQWIRHRWASYNEISGRYTDEISEDYYVPEKFRAQDTKNRQSSIDEDVASVYMDQVSDTWMETDPERDMKSMYTMMLWHQKFLYDQMVKRGLAKELARGILGTAFYTKFVWTVNARSLMNFFILRCESHAQWEIRQYAEAILQIFKAEMPWSYDSIVKLFPSIFGVTQ